MKNTRLTLVNVTKTMIFEGLKLLGIPSPLKM
ncbi:MAG: hypothetical protein K2X69_00635 [Silvanigrellaceae bacterium]|nr:hypothetical protein [Silvanigrellaceae bacterium]